MLDALGFAEAGHGVNLARDGALGIDGALPCNTGGGLVGFGHPVGATGVKQILEVCVWWWWWWWWGYSTRTWLLLWWW